MKYIKYLLLTALLLTAPLAYARDTGVKITLATTSGTVAYGARGLLFIFSADFTGTIAGVAFAGATDSSLQVPVKDGDVLTAVAYTVTAGNVRIVEVR